MRAIVLAGVFCAILLTASVVVGFFQNAGFVAQTSAHRGRRHSMNQVVVSAGTSGADDLSSLLDTAKSEFGAKAANVATSVATSPKGVAKDSLNDVFKATQTTIQQSGSEGKVPSLGSYLVNRNVPSLTASADWDSTKSNIELLKSNTLKMTGRDPSEFQPIDFSNVNLPKISPDDLPKISLGDFPDIGSFDFSSIQQYFSSIQQYFQSLSPENQVLVGVAVGATLIIAGASQKKPSKTALLEAAEESIQATSVVLDGLTDELGTLQSRMKALEASGADLDSQLKDAKSTLVEKELEISKVQLEAADTSLTLNREIDALKEKLQDNNVVLKSLDKDLTTARDECLELVKELEEERKEEIAKAAAEAAKLAKKQKEYEAAKKKKATEEANKLVLEAAKKADEAAKKKRAEEAAKKKEAKEAAAKEKKVKVKRAAKKGAPTKTSNSALSGTNAKVLVAFLDSKGISTVDENGKTLKKARLIEAVNSLYS